MEYMQEQHEMLVIASNQALYVNLKKRYLRVKRDRTQTITPHANTKCWNILAHKEKQISKIINFI